LDPGYDAYHAPRYAFLLRLLAELGLNENTTIMDIGETELTTRMRNTFGMPVDSLGLGVDSATQAGRHFEFDLNRTQRRENWRTNLPTYSFVVMAEVLEHLYTAPQLVLAFVNSLLAQNGFLVLQTPNAAAVTKRIKLLLGRNPYEMIRADSSDPGHYREYTIAELRQIGKDLGFIEERCVTAFYFDARFARHGPNGVRPQPVMGTLKNLLYPAFPKSLREGITIVWRKL
jgi:Methyltransferase domain